MLCIAGTSWDIELAEGERIAFGRGGQGVDLAVSEDRRLHRCCGQITAGRGRWLLDNVGSWLRLRVARSDRGASDQVAPGESAEITWERSTVEICLGNDVIRFEVLSKDPALPAVRPAPSTDPGGGHTVTPLPLDRGSGYFRALVALCEPALRSPHDHVVPSDQQIALRLWQAGTEDSRPTGKTIERRLDHCRFRAGLKDRGIDGSGAGLERRDARHQMIEAALLTGTVTRADLALLDSGVG